jgi:alkanesulfonate monooxygenase SsuD/methylene tetrahydromethanopterin reductase-like flavin-dependent oxidoreductase (luciferase family)
VSGLPSVPPPVQRPHVPLLLGGGGRRILTLAAEKADIVSVNFMISEGYTGPRAAQSALGSATDEKVALIRQVAATAGRKPELHLVAYWAEVSEDREAALARQITKTGIPITPDDLVTSPHCLVGPLSYLKERLEELRERWGFSYISIHDRNAAGAAGLVSAMAGA